MNTKTISKRLEGLNVDTGKYIMEKGSMEMIFIIKEDIKPLIKFLEGLQ